MTPCEPCKGNVRTKQIIKDFPDSAAQIVVTAKGIGDHIGALTVAAGWKEANPDKHLVFVAQGEIAPWVRLFGGYDRLVYDPIGLPDAWIAGNTRNGLHFIEAVANAPQRALPPIHPQHEAYTDYANQYKGAVAISPFTLGSGAGRNWLLSHWLTLERQLYDRGLDTVILDSEEGRIGKFQGRKVMHASPQHVAAILRSSLCLVGGDSGMAHLAGALQVPAVVLSAQLDGAKIHGFWPRSVVVSGPLSCGGCRWTGPNFRGACHQVCANLQAITPEMVLPVIESFQLGKAEPYLADPVLDGEIQRMLARSCVSVADRLADRRGTFSAFLRHLATKERPLVVETGCQRAEDDYGAGQSTQIFGRLLKGLNGQLVSLDNDPDHVAFCRARIFGLPVRVVLTDSRDWLNSCCGQKIDGLYLDSMDLGLPGFENHCWTELQLALPHLATDAMVLIDDTVRIESGWWGKGALAVPWLLENGWQIVCESYQVLLRRK